MTPANQSTLRALRRAVKAQRALREAIEELQAEMSDHAFNDEMLETLEEEVSNLDLTYEELNVRTINMETLQHVRNAVFWVSPKERK